MAVKLPHIVCLGGGSAMPSAVLEGLKKYPVSISAISAMLDSGGSAGRERELFQTGVSFGDIRRAALALSEISQEKKELFGYRFENGVVLANSYFTANVLAVGIEALLEDIKEDLRIANHYKVLPATVDDAVLCAELADGSIVKGETNIDIPKHNGELKIKRAFLKPQARAYPPAVKAIREADLIIMGPGDLYSSLVQILLVKGISEALRKSRALKVYICNLMTKFGETKNFSVTDFTLEIEKYLGEEVGRVIFNQKQCLSSRIADYQKEHSVLLEMVKFSETLDKSKFIGSDILVNSGPIIHDPNKLAKVILSLCPIPLKP